MRLDTSQQMRTDMRLRMAPRMIQSMEILQLPLMALQERIDQELSENPVLVDLRETPAPEAESEETAVPAEPAPTEFEAEGMAEAAPEDDWSESFGEGPRMSRAALSEEADRKHDAMQNMASRPRSLHDDLSDQLGFLDAESAVRSLAEYLVFNLDDNGYLNHELDEMVRDFGGDVTLAQAEEALAMVQKLDPPGVGARTLQASACSSNSPPTSPAVRVLQVLDLAITWTTSSRIAFPPLKSGPVSTIDDIKEAIEHLRRLEPPPWCSHYVRDQLAVCRPRSRRRGRRAGRICGQAGRRPYAATGHFAAISAACSRTSSPIRSPANSSRRRSSRPAG